MMNRKNIDKLVNEALAIEREEASRAGAIGYMARALIQATMPHSKIAENEFKRKNGAFKLTILADSEVGLPYGSIPRLLIAWLTTEAIRTKEKELVLGASLSEFMAALGLIPSGGRWGSITRLKEQMKRLFSASISCTYDDGKNWGVRNVIPVEQADLWWDPKNPSQASMWESRLLLGHTFFEEIIQNPVPIDMRALKALKQSPMALDIYCWLTYRMSYLRKITPIPWEALQVQFGANYKDSRQFKRRFVDQLKKVMVIYPDAKIRESTENLMLLPSRPHVSKQLKTNYSYTDNKADNSQKQNVEAHDLLKEYNTYCINGITDLVDTLPDDEQHKLHNEFVKNLTRQRQYDLRQKIVRGEHTFAVKTALFNFIDKNWHDLLEGLMSYEDFLWDKSEKAIVDK